MTTPDPIALPELPPPYQGQVVATSRNTSSVRKGVEMGGYIKSPELFTADQMHAYGRACVEALPPAPQVPEGMVSVPVRLPALAVSEIKDMLASDYRMHDIQARPMWAEFLRIVAGLSIERQEEINEYRAVAGVAPSTPPLNEPFGNPEELDLNEPSGDSGQLASLEQRAREFLQEHSPDFQAGETRIHYFGALRAIEAALSAQPRGVDSLLTEAECSVIETLLDLAYAAWSLADNGEDAGGESVTIERSDLAKLSEHLDALEALPDDRPGYTMGEAAKARWALRRLLNVPPAAPQPREVRGVDGLVELAKVLPMPDGYELAQELPGIWGYVYNRDDGERMASGTSWNHPALAGVAAWQDVAAATARQDAAGVEPAAWMATSKPSSDGTVAIQFTHNPDYANECRRADWTVTPLYTTPPPGVDVGKLRELRSLLVGIRPEFGQPGSRDVDVRAQQNRIDAAIAIIDGAAPGVGEAVRSVCKWSQQDEGYEVFSTSCGHEYQVNDCTDGNVQLPFCPFCARRVEGSAWAQGDDPLTPTTPPDGAKGER